VESTVSIQLGVSLPVVIDFQGTLTRGITDDLSLDTISFLTDCAPSLDTSISVLFYFSRNVAYMPLAGQVIAVTEEIGDPARRFRIEVSLSPLGNTERVSLSPPSRSWTPISTASRCRKALREPQPVRHSLLPILGRFCPCSLRIILINSLTGQRSLLAKSLAVWLSPLARNPCDRHCRGQKNLCRHCYLPSLVRHAYPGAWCGKELSSSRKSFAI
jgi:hypothetical protein